VVEFPPPTAPGDFDGARRWRLARHGCPWSGFPRLNGMALAPVPPWTTGPAVRGRRVCGSSGPPKFRASIPRYTCILLVLYLRIKSAKNKGVIRLYMGLDVNVSLMNWKLKRCAHYMTSPCSLQHAAHILPFMAPFHVPLSRPDQ
jgi:hypothetical protein